MTVKKSNLSWIVVSDINKAKNFYHDILGMEIHTSSPEHGWVELIGKDGGALLGLAQSNAHNAIKEGSNAVVTLSVDNIEKSKSELVEKGVSMIGDIIEVPGHVKMQMFTDFDNNHFQLVELLENHH
jgi:predicted enzyme related to lactoylglutathione lyase